MRACAEGVESSSKASSLAHPHGYGGDQMNSFPFIVMFVAIKWD